MDASTRFKRGDVRGDGMVFHSYADGYVNGERWVTANELSEIRERARLAQSAYRKTDQSIRYRAEYCRRPDVKLRKNRARCRGIGKGKGKRKDARTPEQAKAYNVQWKKNRRLTDPLFKLAACLRSRTNNLLRQRRIYGSLTLSQYLGCTLEHLRQHLESQFLPGMTWGNHGCKGWHIDHKTPLSSATSKEEFIGLSHYTNLQPLWYKDNLSKWAHMPEQGGIRR